MIDRECEKASPSHTAIMICSFRSSDRSGCALRNSFRLAPSSSSMTMKARPPSSPKS